MKKTLFLFMAMLALGVTASAQDVIQVFQDGDWLYTINSDTDHEVAVVHYAGEEDESKVIELTIPSHATYNGSSYSVTELGRSLFSSYDNSGSTDYTQGWRHGTYTSLEKVTIPNTVTIIGESAFEDCTGLTSVNIPKSVTKIGSYTFYGCTSLQEIIVEEGNPVYKTVDGAVYNPELTSILICPTGKQGHFKIPNFVTEIGARAFCDCTGLTSIDIPDSVKEIGEGAFVGSTGLTSIDIPDSVTEIGEGTFIGCTGLTSIDIPDSVTRIKSYTFRGCTGLTSIDIPDSVKEIGESAFEGCTNLTSIDIPDSVTEIGWGAFQECTGLTSIDISDSLTEIGECAFFGCTGLTSIDIPDSVTRIGDGAFHGCTGLTSVNIPDSVTYIDWKAFLGCTSLTTIFALPVVPPTNDYEPFTDVPETAVVYIPKGSLNAYSTAYGWNRFTDFREMGALDIALSESSISIEEGRTVTLSATVTKDDDVTVASETWASSDPGVATVDNDGVVTAVSVGTAKISLTVVDGYGCRHTEYCKVKVSPGSGVDGIAADGSDAPAEYFTLNGTRVSADTLSPGIYIRRQGGKATKVMVK